MYVICTCTCNEAIILIVSSEPETAPLPGEWDNACNELQRMLIVRSLRPDRVAFCATSFIVNNLGSKFTEPPVLDMHQVTLCQVYIYFFI